VPRVTTAVVAVGLLLCGLLSLTAGLILHSIARRSQEFEYHMQVLADELRAGRDRRPGRDDEDGLRDGANSLRDCANGLSDEDGRRRKAAD
jgi:hypothetical protein